MFYEDSQNFAFLFLPVYFESGRTSLYVVAALVWPWIDNIKM